MIDTENCQNKYFEWWYFHFLGENGLIFNLLIHSTDIFGLSAQEYMTISAILPDSEVRYFKQELPEQSFERNPSIFECRSNFLEVKDSGDHTYLKLEFPDLEFEIDLKEMHSPVHNDTPLLYSGTLSPQKEQHYWVHVVPFGRFELRGSIDASPIQESGKFYHDHNWGNAPIHENVKSWISGHATFDSGYVFFSYLVLKNNEIITRYSCNIDEYESSSGLILNSDLEHHGKTKYISLVNEDGLNIQVRNETIFKSRHDEFAEQDMTYYRSHCLVKLSNKKEMDIEGVGIFEEFQFI